MRQRPGVVLVAGIWRLAAADGGGRSRARCCSSTACASNDTALQARFLARNRTLERIRSNIYLSGTFVRDFLLAPEQTGARAQLTALEGLRRDSENALNNYASALEPEEVGPFRDLRSQIEAYWRVLDRTFAWTAEERDKYPLCLLL